MFFKYNNSVRNIAVLDHFSLVPFYTDIYKKSYPWLFGAICCNLSNLFTMCHLLNVENCPFRWLAEYLWFLIAAATFCPNVSEWFQAFKCATGLTPVTWAGNGAESQGPWEQPELRIRHVFGTSASFKIWKTRRSRSAGWKGVKPCLIFWSPSSFEEANFCSSCNDPCILSK